MEVAPTQTDVDRSKVSLRLGRIAIGDPLIHQRLCLDRAGIAILPDWLIQDQVRKKQLLRVLPEWVPNPVELFVLYPTRLSMTPKLNVFLAFIQEVVPNRVATLR